MNDNRTDLVMLHGWGMNSAVWGALLSALGGRLKPVPIDLPGHGDEPFDAALRWLPHWADDCLRRAPDHAIWLGWSLGGMVAIQAALQAPKRVHALVLMGATPRFVQAVDWRAAVAEETLVQFGDGLRDDPDAVLDRFLALQVRGSSEARATLRKLRGELARRPAPDPEALSAGLDILREEDLRGPLPDLTMPALWLFGDRDTLVPSPVAERVSLLTHQARTRVIGGAAHAAFLSHTETVVGEINAFLDGTAQ
ncbi:MAG: pimeloyl-ACP methyl ester esterase BioH [Thiohalocapsa sp.]